MRRLARLAAGMAAALALGACNLPAPTATPPKPTQTLATALPAPSRTPAPMPTLTVAPAPTRTPIPPRASGPTPTPGLAPTPMPAANTLTITLKSGLKWSDGSPFTAKDVAGTYDILWAQDHPIWTLLRNVRAADDRTVVFDFQIANVWAQHAILRGQAIAPASQYGWLMDEAAEMRAGLAGANSPERRAFLEALQKYNPVIADGIGPYRMESDTITSTVLTKNAGGYAAGAAQFDQIELAGGSVYSAAVLYSNGELDYAPVLFPSATLSELRSLPGAFAPAGSTGMGVGMWMNAAREPFAGKEMRQALAYSINRQMALSQTLGEGGTSARYMAGFSDALAPQYLPGEVISRLNTYAPNPDRAAITLVTQGYTRGTDKLWRNAKGALLAPVISAPEEYADLLALAENIREQLNAAGWSARVQAMPAAQLEYNLRAGNFDLMLGDIFHAGPPHPAAALGEVMAGIANNPAAPRGSQGMGWAWQHTLPGGGPLDVPKTLAACAEGFGVGKPNPACVKLALLFNEQLPVLPLLERSLTDVVNTQGRAMGWAPAGGPVWRQNALTENAIAAQIFAGTLKPAADNATRRLVIFAPAAPLGAYSRNPFHENFAGAALGPVAGPLVNPPLFWFNWADSAYEPMLAEKFEFK